MGNVAQAHLDELARRALNNAAIPEVGVFTDEDTVFIVGRAGDLLVRRIPSLWHAVHVLSVMARLRKCLGQVDRDVHVAQEPHHATSPSECPETVSLA